MKVAVIGTGYVGLVTGTCLAETGNEVICVDIDQDKVEKLQNGVLTIYEPGLDILYERNYKEKRLFFSTDLAEACRRSEVVFLALPTPAGEDGSADLSHFLKVATQLPEYIKKYTVVVDKSTVPVGTAEQVEALMAESLDRNLFDVVSNPEFLREGVAVGDFLKPERIIIGTRSKKAKRIMKELYKPYIRQGNPIYYMDPRSAEMTKYASNAYLATRISFMNEMANLCELTGANVDMVRKGMGSDSRIGPRFLYAGVGYGGSCFPKDVKALEKTAQDYSYNFKILKAVMDVNKAQKNKPFDKLRSLYGKKLKNKTIAIWGLAFKPDTDDIREAPSINLLDALVGKCKEIRVFDPEALDNVMAQYGDRLYYAQSQYDAIYSADALVVLTEWTAFRNPDLQFLKETLGDGVVFDGRNIFDPEEMIEVGFDYYSIGRPVDLKSLDKEKEEVGEVESVG